MVHWRSLLLILIAVVNLAAQGQPERQHGPKQPSQASRCNDVPAHPFDIILGRPTSNSVTLRVLCYEDAEGFVRYGLDPKKLTEKTPPQAFSNGTPAEIFLSSLRPNTKYYYQLHLAQQESTVCSFHTARDSESAFTFTITADSHLDEHTDPDLYRQTLANVLADEPDFHIDLGDTFMTEKHESRAAAAKQYLSQRYYFGQLCSSAPLFLVLGNHDGERPRGRGESDELAVWSNAMRKRYFPNPVPDNFFSGNSVKHPEAGLLQDYFAWQWGDALFIVLDPFWYGQRSHHKGDNWNCLLGDEQYRWLKRTLESSVVKFKFVFIHHLVGGYDDQDRGGIEAAPFFEWGGKNADGSDGFKVHRPGWPEPIHQLLVHNHVSIVFHGHDHFYAKQNLDGIIYQEVPQPGDPRGKTDSAADYGYRSGVILPSSGHVRVAVSSNKATVDYVCATITQSRNENRKNRQILDSYSIPDDGKQNSSTEVTKTNSQNFQPKQQRSRQSPKSKTPKNAKAEQPLPNDVAALEKLSLVLGRPTDRSVTVNVLSAEALEAYCEYGVNSLKYSQKTLPVLLTAGKPVEILLDRLPANARCYYRLRYRKPTEKNFAEGAEHSFSTQRTPGNVFTFEIQGDSHPERSQQFNPAIYAQTLRSAAADQPDFYMTIGDDFSVDTLHDFTAEAIGNIYQRQRCFLGLVAHSSPVYLVNGNHELAAACNLDGTANNVAVLAQTYRNSLFPQPAPDGFYTGDAQPVEFIDLLRDYYAWTWGDALFVVLDPYWHSPVPVDNVFGGDKKPHRDLWEVTLGDAQYRWFERTLRESKSKFKFVFAHHVLGTGRGGVEEAGLFEWGGNNKNGRWQFNEKRPGWELPIHQLMDKYGVTIFFQGHDHVFARQQLDGVVYQTLPEPADPNYELFNKDAYATGDVFPNSGRVRVIVSSEKVTVEYIRSWLPKDETEQHKDGEIAYRYSLPPASAKHAPEPRQKMK